MHLTHRITLTLILLIFSNVVGVSTARSECRSDLSEQWLCAGDKAPYTGYLVSPLQMKGMVADAERGELVPTLRLEIATLSRSLQDKNTTMRKQDLKIGSLKDDLFVERHKFDWGDFVKGVGLGTAIGVVAVIIALFAI